MSGFFLCYSYLMDPENVKIPAIIVVPLEKLSDQALEGLIDEFILREGTDYGKNEYSLEQKHEQVKKQLESEQVLVVFDTEEQTCSIARKESIPKHFLD